MANAISLEVFNAQISDMKYEMQNIFDIELPKISAEIEGVEGKLIDYRADENRLFWHACDRAFRINYPREVLSDEAAIALAASLNAACS